MPDQVAQANHDHDAAASSSSSPPITAASANMIALPATIVDDDTFRESESRRLATIIFELSARMRAQDAANQSGLGGYRTINQIDDYVFLSNARGASDIEQLVALGITAVLNVTKTTPYPAKGLQAGIEYHRIAIDDLPTEQLLPYLDDAYELIETYRVAEKRLLVHCQAGVSRSASVVIAYIMRSHNVPLADAYKHVVQKRPIIFPNLGFWTQLIDYETRLRGSASVRLVRTRRGLRADVTLAGERLDDNALVPDLLQEQQERRQEQLQGHQEAQQEDEQQAP